MAELKVVQYLKQGGTTGDEVDDFLNWYITLCKDGGARKASHGLSALGKDTTAKTRPPQKERHIFFEDELKDCLRHLSGEGITNDPPREGSITISKDIFVKHVLKHIDEGAIHIVRTH